MPHRKVAAENMAAFLNVLSHPDRVRICLELQAGELEVSVLRTVLDISASRLSQHLGMLKSEHIVAERKEGRKVLYHLEDLGLGAWLLASQKFLRSERRRLDGVMEALDQASLAWGADLNSGPRA